MENLKKIWGFLLILLMMSVACNNGQGTRQDSTEIADRINDTTAQVNESDARFAVSAADHNLGGIQLANLAMENANDARIKAIALNLLQEHQQANQELSSIGNRKMITLPDVTGDRQMDDLRKLHNEKADHFDRTYLQLMIEHHEDMRSLLEKASDDARDADLQAYASKYLPLIKRHEEHLKNLSDSMGYKYEDRNARNVIP